MRKLGIRPAGGSHSYIRKRLAYFEIDISHFLGKRWNAMGRRSASSVKKSCQQILILGQEGQAPEKIYLLRRALLETGREYKCTLCGCGAERNGQRLVLQIDHINGLRHDNRAENVRFLCPNCHSQTPTFNQPHR